MPPRATRRETILFGTAVPDPGTRIDWLFLVAAFLSMVLLLALIVVAPGSDPSPAGQTAGSVSAPDGP